MSTKQIKHSVAKGRQVSFLLAVDDLLVRGYVCGVDDYHWLVADPVGKTIVLVHKSASLVVLHAQSTYEKDAEGNLWLHSVVQPFMDFCVAHQ